jgi:hypothetical protein
VAAEVVARVEELVNDGCKLCQNAMRAEGIKVMVLMSRDIDEMGHIQCHIERAKWTRILDVSSSYPSDLPSLGCFASCARPRSLKGWHDGKGLTKASALFS